MLMLIIPAYVAEDDPAMDESIQQEQEFKQEQDKEPVVVASLEELQEAIDAADDGDTIATSNKIEIRENCSIGLEPV